MIKLILGNKEQGKKKNWMKNILMEETKVSYKFSLKKKKKKGFKFNVRLQMRPSHPGMLNRVALSTYLPLLSAKVIKQYLMPAALNHSKSK